MKITKELLQAFLDKYGITAVSRNADGEQTLEKFYAFE